MMTRLLFTILFLFSVVQTTEARTLGYLRFKVQEINDKHNTNVSILLNGRVITQFAHATSAMIDVDVDEKMLAKNARSTPYSSDYRGLNARNSSNAEHCEFGYTIQFSLDKKSWTLLGVYKAPMTDASGSIPLGLCNGELCSSNPQISRRLENDEGQKEKKKKLEAEARKRLENERLAKLNQERNEKISQVENARSRNDVDLESRYREFSEIQTGRKEYRPEGSLDDRRLPIDLVQQDAMKLLREEIQKRQLSGQWGLENPGQVVNAVQTCLTEQGVRLDRISDQENKYLAMDVRDRSMAADEMSHWTPMTNALVRGAVGFMPLIGDTIDLAELTTGREWGYLNGRELAPVERLAAGIGLIALNRPMVMAGARGAANMTRSAVTSLKNAFARGTEFAAESMTFARMSEVEIRQYATVKPIIDEMKALQRSGQSIDSAARKMAIQSTNQAGYADRVVLGTWVEGGGYVAEAKMNGGIWFETPKRSYEYMGKGFDVSTQREMAWSVNKQFLTDQMERGVSRIDVVNDDVRRILKYSNAQDQGRFVYREMKYIQENAAKYGYELRGNSWIRVKSK